MLDNMESVSFAMLLEWNWNVNLRPWEIRPAVNVNKSKRNNDDS